MVEVMHLYLDESGTRHPNKDPGTTAEHGYDWFSLGGVLLDQRDEDVVRAQHREFMARWGLDPKEVFLHSAEIRHKGGAFTWLAGLPEDKLKGFLDDLYGLMAGAPVLGFACAIDRPGYNSRYLEKYGRQQWSLCRTAFSVVVERAAKYAATQGCKLKVFAERSDKISDAWMRGYYDHMRTNGMPFNASNMEKYQPLSQKDLHSTLYEFRTKKKSSPPMQLADLYVWPMAIGGYHQSNRTYARLRQDGKLIDCKLSGDEIPVLGIKYSCWDLVTVKP